MYVKVALIILALFILYLYVQNYLHQLKKYTLVTHQLDSKLKNKKIVFISDTHFRENTSLAFIDRITVEIEDIAPDLILFGGDIVHKLDREKVLEYTKDFFYQLNKIAPTYLTFGNHDLASDRLDEIESAIKLSGANVLKNQSEWVNFKDSTDGFWLMGLCAKPTDLVTKADVLSEIKLPYDSDRDMKILIAHHPEYFEKYLFNKQTRPDLILSGHSHGGQVILPVFGGLFAPGQGKNPKYDFGLFTNDKYPGSRMIVTRGLGNSNFPFRINNRPEIVVINFE